MEAIFHLRLFGAVQVEREGKPVRGFKSRKALAVLSYLALQARPVSRSHLADLFWGEKTEARGRANLSWVLHRLATLLPGCLQVDRHSVQFRPGPRFWLDTVAFVDLVAQGEPAALAAAAELYRGEFLAGLELEGCPEFETWLVVQRESWYQRATRVLQELIAYHTGRGEYRAGLRWAMRLLALDPWREEAHRQVMWLLARTGQRGAALAQYESCRRVLAEEFGAEPSQETQALYERILVAPVRRHNLPLQPTSFVGREAELEALARRLADPGCRLVTLVGPGGIGKTRLAIQAAAQHVDAFLHGVTFVPLTPVSSPEHVIPAVADALGCSFYGREEPKVQLLKYLGAKELLLVLDNFEHLLEGTDLIVDLLEGAPEVKLLVTSRERLNLRAEWLFAIEGLAYPTSSRTTVAPSPLSCQERGEGGGGSGVRYSAVQLFLQRARQLDWRFSPSEEESFVVRICKLVSGMPLGIELAAAQVGERSCREIAEALERNLDFLRTTLRDVPPRHRSLRAAFDHSWALLSDEEQRVFRRLSVFRGGFRQEAAARVAAASRLVLSALERKSLLRCDAAGRFEVHEVLRQYAQQKLQAVPGEEEMIQELHCGYYAAFLEQRESDLTGSRCEAALEEIGAEIDNVRASWRWAIARGKEAEIAKSLESLRHFYEVRGWFQEGEETFGRAVEKLRGQIEQVEELQRPTGLLLGQILARRGAFCIELGQYAQAGEFLQTSLSLLRHWGARPGLSFPLLYLGSLAFSRGEYAEARQYHQKSLAISREVGDRYGTARALLYLGTVATWTGEYLEAKQLFQDSLAICRAMEEQLLMARVLNNLGNVAYFLKEYAEAKQFYQESLAFRTRLNDQLGIGACLNNLGEVAYALGEYRPAGHYFREALKIMANIKTVHAVLHIVTSIAALLAQDGEKARAIEMLVLVLHHPANSKTTRDRAEHLLSELALQLSAQQAAAAQERGKARRLDELVRQFASS